jgi:hypothetical protein
MFFQVVLPIRLGPGQIDSINRLIQLTVIQLSGGHCIGSSNNSQKLNSGLNAICMCHKWHKKITFYKIIFVRICIFTFSTQDLDRNMNHGVFICSKGIYAEGGTLLYDGLGLN